MSRDESGIDCLEGNERVSFNNWEGDDVSLFEVNLPAVEVG